MAQWVLLYADTRIYKETKTMKTLETINHSDGYTSEWECDSESGLICSPGKFEGEPLYAPYFYHIVMMGDGECGQDGDGNHYDDIEITDEDRAEFVELCGYSTIRIFEDTNGFCYSALIDD